jgi:hypothetical protein
MVLVKFSWRQALVVKYKCALCGSVHRLNTPALDCCYDKKVVKVFEQEDWRIK